MLIWIGDAKVIKAKGRFCIFVCGGDEASKTRSIRDEISAVTDMWTRPKSSVLTIDDDSYFIQLTDAKYFLASSRLG
jgi:hypothetical protein